MNALQAKNLSKRYGDFLAVDSLDLSIEQGTLYGFLGPNGAGKTTTIRMALGLIWPTAGEVSVFGERVLAAPTAHVLTKVGALVEEPGFWKHLSGRRNLEAFAGVHRSSQERAKRLGRIEEVLRLVDLHDAADKRVKAYSQGMRQRLGVAQALLGAPELLVLDEPTNGLDPQGMRDMRLLLKRLASEGTTIFVSSHLLGEVEALCDRVGVLAQGKLVAEGPPSELRTGTDTLRIEVDDRARAEKVLAKLNGVAVQSGEGTTMRLKLSESALPETVNAALVKGGVAVKLLVPERATLEEVFVALVEGHDVPR
ncbi:MAG: ABC transporter ATP-binding protein [Actinomycetota bacterium]